MNIRQKAMDTAARWRKERTESRRMAAVREADRRIQVREFDGMLCLSLDGMPVMPMKEFDRKVLSDARLTFYNYIESRI